MKHDRAKFRRCARVRRVLKSRSTGRSRLSVFRSSKQIYAQIIDDTLGKTLVSASSLEAQMRSELTSGSDRQAAHRIGKLIAERAKKAGIEKVVFDRGGYAYHGRVQALADGAREEGLQF